METIAALTDPRDRKQFYYHATLFRQIIVWIVRLIFRFLARIEVHGLEHLPADGPVVLACNHLTNFDVFPMQLVLPRPIFFMGKEELFRNPVMDWAFRQLGAFPVYRGERDEWAILHAERVLAHRQVLGIFPEGGRSKGGSLRKGKSGAARLASQTGCPIVPMSIQGTNRIGKSFHRPRVIIQLCPPVYPGHAEPQTALTERMMTTIAGSLPPEMRGVYSA